MKNADVMTEKAIKETCYWDEGLHDVRVGIDKMQSAYQLRISSYKIAVDDLNYEIGSLRNENEELKRKVDLLEKTVHSLIDELDFHGIPLPDINFPD